MTGLSIEEHTVVVAAITDALARLIPFNRDRAATQLYVANRRLQIQFVEQLAWVVALFADHDNWKDSPQVWELACSYTGYERQALEDLPDLRRAEFNVARQEASLTVRTTDKESTRSIEETAGHRLTAIGSRLRQNVALLVQPFDRKRVVSTLDLSGAFLAAADFPVDANLRGVKLNSAILCDAHFAHANLSNMFLKKTRLEGAALTSSDLYATTLTGACIDHTTRFSGSNWWTADYGDFWNPNVIDGGLIEKLIAYLGELSPEQLNEAHPSVETYIAKRNRLSQAEAANQNTQPPPSATS